MHVMVCPVPLRDKPRPLPTPPLPPMEADILPPAVSSLCLSIFPSPSLPLPLPCLLPFITHWINSRLTLHDVSVCLSLACSPPPTKVIPPPRPGFTPLMGPQPLVGWPSHLRSLKKSNSFSSTFLQTVVVMMMNRKSTLQLPNSH